MPTPLSPKTSDATTGITTSLSDAYGKKVTGSLETSARRGDAFTAKAEQNFNPYSGELNDFLEEAMEPLGGMFPIDTSITKELWSVKFTVPGAPGRER